MGRDGLGDGITTRTTPTPITLFQPFQGRALRLLRTPLPTCGQSSRALMRAPVRDATAQAPAEHRSRPALFPLTAGKAGTGLIGAIKLDSADTVLDALDQDSKVLSHVRVLLVGVLTNELVAKPAKCRHCSNKRIGTEIRDLVVQLRIGRCCFRTQTLLELNELGGEGVAALNPAAGGFGCLRADEHSRRAEDRGREKNRDDSS
jgi:hypothetical protein